MIAARIAGRAIVITAKFAPLARQHLERLGIAVATGPSSDEELLAAGASVVLPSLPDFPEYFAALHFWGTALLGHCAPEGLRS